MASLRPKRSSINTKTRYTDLQNQIFIESIIGLNIIVNPIYVQRSNLWDIDWNVQGSKNSSGIGMSKDPKILWASVCFAAEEDEQDESYWCVAAEEDEKDDSLTIYDISAGIILDFEWFRNAILKYVSTQNATSSALKLWMTDKCQDLRKYKKKAKRYRHKAVKSMVDVMKCLMQYGAYLGFFISSTLNQCGQKQQNSRHIKMPLIVWNKANLFDDFISYSQFKYSKNGGKYHVLGYDMLKARLTLPTLCANPNLLYSLNIIICFILRFAARFCFFKGGSLGSLITGGVGYEFVAFLLTSNGIGTSLLNT
eukprot:437081_1